jgi:hypothetical protein
LDPVPLDTAVTAQPAPIIASMSVYPDLVYSGHYHFEPIAQDGPFILGLISVSSTGAMAGRGAP